MEDLHASIDELILSTSYQLVVR